MNRQIHQLFLLFLPVFFSCVIIVNIVNAATYTVFPTEDTYVGEKSPYNIMGALNYIQIGGDKTAMLKFNFDFIGQDEYVVAATLFITGWWIGPNNSYIELYHFDNDSWNEQTLSWSNQPAYEMNENNLVGRQNYFFPFAELQWNLLKNMEWDSLLKEEDNDTQLSLLLVSLSEIDNMFFFTKEGFFPPSISIITETGQETPVPLPSSFWLLCIPCLIHCIQFYKFNTSKKIDRFTYH
ncbi:DUF7594 domain-containing protein [Desulfobacter latus]|uniref:DNRLRE domain-containing protein n=1 Tax=Desulfobacter latus TaxID=2292 RepID=A0A850T7B5_9BACT|nr:DNRLRE domain-containing protein [Desulfobacter latus]NWH04278.1 DNRLRE domain-containing protein [Desulfobacter latus]